MNINFFSGNSMFLQNSFFNRMANQNQPKSTISDIVNMMNQRASDAGEEQSQAMVVEMAQTEAAAAAQSNSADSTLLTPAQAAKINAAMSQVALAPEQKTADDYTWQSWLLSNEAMTVSEAVNALPKKIDFENQTVIGTSLEELRENGLAKEIDYTELEHSLYPTLRYNSITHVDDVADVVDYFASTYAVLQQRIQKDYTGEEQAEQMSTLDAFMRGQIERFSTEFAETLSDFDAQIGLGDTKAQLQASMQAAMEEQTDKYKAFIEENADYANLEGSEDAAWLSRHTAYMRSHLQSAYAAANSESTVTAAAEDGLYSLEELSDMAELAKDVTKVWNRTDTRSNMDEEQLGVRFGMMAVAVDVLADKSGVSGQYRDAVKAHSAKRIAEEIDRINSVLTSTEYQTRIQPALDTNVIDSIIQSMRNTYEQTGNVSSAIQKGVSAGYGSYYQRLSEYQSGESAVPSRYNGEKAFWSGMYSSNGTGGSYTSPSVMASFHQQLSSFLGEEIALFNSLDQKV